MRCFTYVNDATRGTVLVGNSAETDGECFNIGSDRETTVDEVVNAICELTGSQYLLCRLTPLPNLAPVTRTSSGGCRTQARRGRYSAGTARSRFARAFRAPSSGRDAVPGGLSNSRMQIPDR
jgi:nucleoside-diphosphate-sugar epimerase